MLRLFSTAIAAGGSGGGGVYKLYEQLPKELPARILTQHSCISINNQCSHFVPVLAGVPQGSILGPFLIYINDLPLSTFFSTLLLFVDDTQCIRPVLDATMTLVFSNRILINTLTN